MYQNCRRIELNGELREDLMIVDQYYISARYPDALPDGAPYNSFSEKQAEHALETASGLIEKIRAELYE